MNNARTILMIQKLRTAIDKLREATNEMLDVQSLLRRELDELRTKKKK